MKHKVSKANNRAEWLKELLVTIKTETMRSDYFKAQSENAKS